MERIKDETSSNARMMGGNSHPTSEEGASSSPSSTFRSTLFLDNVGEVLLSFNSDGLCWELLDTPLNDRSICFGLKLNPNFATEIKFSDVYGVEFLNYGLIHGYNLPNVGKHLLARVSQDFEMYRFSVHGFQKSKTQPCLWVLSTYTFGLSDLKLCKRWIDQINTSLDIYVGRPKNVLVFVNPKSGKGNGCKTWQNVAHVFSRAKVETKVIVTKRQGHAFDVMATMANKELNSYDGFIAVGGDGFFNEILNGFLLSRHKAPLPPHPLDFARSVEGSSSDLVQNPNEAIAETSYPYEDSSPLLSQGTLGGSGLANNGTDDGPGNTDQELDFSLLNDRIRFGIIPAGSTDAIVMCTTGVRDPITSALHIVLGKKLHLDIAQVVRWKTTSVSENESCVRYAASFAGYGFYGDVITESEKYRWMGPKRYDYAGTKVFLRHRSYEAEVAYLETESEKTGPTFDKGPLLNRIRAVWHPDKSERMVCRLNCGVCNSNPVHLSTGSPHSKPNPSPEPARWQRCKGSFLSVGAAIISNRNERAPDGLVVDAHLSDGFLHLLLVRDCPRASYLWHLTQLARRGGRPLNFEFVEHHKTPVFTFTSFGNESIWNLDGEPFPAHQLSAQVLRGLVSLFASGPEV
ncbi:hypothetical protein K2173_027500 [Erythroxylum novogranatense]|uniref:DAGKc domain-containing protein n=1 Tax=Erythroxylum novogranatense TaxID=1862640 RepID=A0AAV8U344_9ROSI|nr:hypothetical protein K2173_027500 [Erythroxylum novogranatense]